MSAPSYLDHEGIAREYAIWKAAFPGPTLQDFLYAASMLGMEAWDVDVMDVNDRRRIRAEAERRGVASIERLADMWRTDHEADR